MLLYDAKGIDIMFNTLEKILKIELEKKGYESKYIEQAINEIKPIALEQTTYFNKKKKQKLYNKKIITLKDLLELTQENACNFLGYIKPFENEIFIIIKKLEKQVENKIKIIKEREQRYNSAQKKLTIENLLIINLENEGYKKNYIQQALIELKKVNLNQFNNLNEKIVTRLSQKNITTLDNLLKLTKNNVCEYLGLNNNQEDNINTLINKLQTPLKNQINKIMKNDKIDKTSFQCHHKLTQILDNITTMNIYSYLKAEIEILEQKLNNQTNKKSVLDLDESELILLKTYLEKPKSYEEITKNAEVKTKIITMYKELMNFQNKIKYLYILEKMRINLTDLNLTKKTINILNCNNIFTIRDLILHSEKEIKEIFTNNQEYRRKILNELNNKNIILLNDREKLKENIKIPNAGINFEKKIDIFNDERSISIQKKIIKILENTNQFKEKIKDNINFQGSFDKYTKFCHEEIIKTLKNINSKELITYLLSDIDTIYSNQTDILRKQKQYPLNKHELEILKKYIENINIDKELPKDNKSKLCIMNIYIELRYYLSKIKYKQIITNNSITLNDLDLTFYTIRKLKENGINSIEELIDYDEKELLKRPNFGKTTLEKIKEALEKRNIIFLNDEELLKQKLTEKNAGIITEKNINSDEETSFQLKKVIK